MLNVNYPHHPPLHSTNCSVRNQGSVASAGIPSPGFPPPLSFCPFNLHSTNVVTILESTFVQTGASPRIVSNRPGSVSLWTPSLPQPRHRSRLKASIRQKAAHPRKHNFHRSMQAQSRLSSGSEHARPSLSSPTTSVHSVGGSYS